MATGDVYYVKFKFADTDEGKVYTPGFHVRQDGVSFDANAIATEMRAWWNNANPVAMKTYYAANIELQAILIRRVSPLEPLEQIITTSLPVAGTSSGDGGDPGACLLISFRTPNIGKSYRGRMYLPSPSESYVESAGVITDATAQDIADQTKAHFDALGAIGQLTPDVVWSPKLSLATNVTRRLVSKQLRSQRRRTFRPSTYFEG